MVDAVVDGIGGSTEFVGVIGDPVRHSLSPRLHNSAYREMGLDLRYGAFRVPVGEAHGAINGARSLGFRGLSITTPHKTEAARYADQRSNDVALLGAANTIVFLASVAVAESTDGDGLLDDLATNENFSPTGKRCVILGAGGAARSIILALGRAGAGEIVVINRSEQHATEAVALAPKIARVGKAEDIDGAPLVINATSMGLTQSTPDGHDGGLSFGRRVGPGQLAVELSYLSRTPFLTAAVENGATARNGLGMLVHQAARQVRLFTGQEAPLSVMWESVRQFISD